MREVTAADFKASSYGWRARIGMLKPSPVIDTNGHEFYLMAPEGVELFVISLGLGGMIASEYERVIAGVETPLRAIIRHAPDSIVQAGVPPIVTRGWGFEDELRAHVRELTDVPFFTDVGASLLALSVLSCRRVVVVSHTFDDELFGQIAEYLSHAGVEVVGTARVGEDDATEAARLPLEQVYRTTRRAYEKSRSVADGVWITQASMPSVGALEALERDLGCPVVSSAQALMWTGLRGAGVRADVDGFGRLLRIPELPI